MGWAGATSVQFQHSGSEMDVLIAGGADILWGHPLDPRVWRIRAGGLPMRGFHIGSRRAKAVRR